MSAAPPLVLVTDAAASAEADRRTIALGVPSRALMQRAGAAAAAELARRYARRLAGGVAVFAGTGNNGGDAWVVARTLAAAGVRVRVHATGEPRTEDAAAERALALPLVGTERPRGDERVVVDGVLGTGAGGAPRGAAAEALACMRRMREGGARVVALDVPSGLDATSGAADGALVADLTLTFGTLKRGLLVARAHAGRIVVLDIGLAPDATATPRLVTGAWVRGVLPAIAADAHKGTRRKVAIIGGAPGMAGAAVLAARAALASGVGMVRAVVAPESLPAVQAGAPESLASPWPTSAEGLDGVVGGWADAVLVGPGLSTRDDAGRLLEWVLERWDGPLVLDADALNLLAPALDGWRAHLASRPTLLTPHPAECARLAGTDVADVLARRFHVGAELAARAGATVLLKGTPSIVSAPAVDAPWVSAAGTPALATAGSGDVLAGVAVTLLAQLGDARAAGAAAAWAHGRAAELAHPGRRVRGVVLGDVMAALPAVWREPVAPPRPPVLVELPPVGERSPRD